MTTTRRARTTKYFQVATSQDQDVCVAGCPLPLQLRSYGATGFAGLVLSWQLPTPTNRHTRHANLRLRFPARRPITNHSNLSFYVETTSSSLRATKTVSLTVKHAHETPHCSRRGERRRRQPRDRVDFLLFAGHLVVHEARKRGMHVWRCHKCREAYLSGHERRGQVKCRWLSVLIRPSFALAVAATRRGRSRGVPAGPTGT